MKVMKKNIEKKITFHDAITNRDSMAKRSRLYENIFLWFGGRINAELCQTEEQEYQNILFIGILDVFGFENFTNEKLHQYFNFHIIRS